MSSPGWLPPERARRPVAAQGGGPAASQWRSARSQPVAGLGPQPGLETRAGVWSRIAAYLVDGGVATITAAALTRLTGAEVFVSAEYLLIATLTWAVVRVGVPLIAGESPGKRLGGLRTVDEHGVRLGTSTRLVREVLLYPLYLIPFGIIADALAADRPARRSLRDRMSGTYVIREQRATSGGLLLGLAASCLTVACWAGAVALYQPVSSVDGQRSDFVEGCTDSGGSAASCACIFESLHAQLGGRRIDEIGRAGVENMPADAASAFDAATARCAAGEPGRDARA